MSLHQSIASAQASQIGPHGVTDDVLGTMLAKTHSALDKLRRQHADETLPLRAKCSAFFRIWWH